MAVRLKDIAQRMNVSIVTVSKVLNGDRTISEKTRQKVLECARELGYRANLTARSLVTGRSQIIGLIVPDLFHGFFSEVAAHMSDVLRASNYGLLIASSREDGDLEDKEIDQMLARRVDALVVASCKQTSSALDTAASELPVVLLDRRVELGRPASYVGTDNLMAGRLATQHLIAQGRRRIAYIGASSSSAADDREHAYRTALQEQGLNLPERYIVKRGGREESSPLMGALAMQQLLTLKPRPDAVFCYNDPTAIGAMAAVLDAGLSIPEDIAIIGCGNIQHAAYARVPLSSVDQNMVKLGHCAAELAIANIECAPELRQTAQPVVVEPTLVVRQSSPAVVAANASLQLTPALVS